ncbi:hypothetical protein BV25DRAFT_1918953 [Artomyces pyxidatus]|uniref:Uncharacterized protein n=1 Tax=Artomyces pyxidatus TaxID=48021 RepID=A0ACB8SSC0_9AGAM|nr:hypothetical protein BV25DRAFT_1918953 [Artomyces pyxidatus]
MDWQQNQNGEGPDLPPPGGLIGPGQAPPGPDDVMIHDGGAPQDLDDEDGVPAPQGEGHNGGIGGGDAAMAFEAPLPGPILTFYDPLRRTYNSGLHIPPEPSIHGSRFLPSEEYASWPLLHYRMPSYYNLCIVSFAVFLTSAHSAGDFWAFTVPFDEASDLYTYVRIAMSTVASLRVGPLPTDPYVFPRETNIFEAYTNTMLRLVAEQFSEFRASIIRTAFDLIVAPLLKGQTCPSEGADARRTMAQGLVNGNMFLHSAAGQIDYLNTHILYILQLVFWQNSRATAAGQWDLLGIYRCMVHYAEGSGTAPGARAMVDWLPSHLYLAVAAATRQALSSIATDNQNFAHPSLEEFRRVHQSIENSENTPAFYIAMFQITAQ